MNGIQTANILTKEILSRLNQGQGGPVYLGDTWYNHLVDGLITDDPQTFEKMDTQIRNEQMVGVQSVSSSLSEWNEQLISEKVLLMQAETQQNDAVQLEVKSRIDKIKSEMNPLFSQYESESVSGDYHYLDPRKRKSLVDSATSLSDNWLLKNNIDPNNLSQKQAEDWAKYLHGLINNKQAPFDWNARGIVGLD